MQSFDLPRFLSDLLGDEPYRGDVLFAVGCPPQRQVDGALEPLPVAGLTRLSPYQTEMIVVHLLSLAPAAAAQRLREEGAAHFAYSLPGVSRFRVAIFSQRGTFALTLRSIPERIPALRDLCLPDAVGEACQERSGIVLVNGPAGSGRTTTLAAIVGELNAGRACHILTVEDPIEFLHRHSRATVNQREVGIDTPSVAQGLSDALRQGAQVVATGGVGDADEARLLLEAAETGHLVLTSLRGLDTATAVGRFLAFFPPEEREEARQRLARVLRWSFTQQLLPHGDGRRPVVEVWRATRSTLAHLVGGNLEPSGLADLLRDGENEGLVAFDRELERRVRNGVLTRDVAIASALTPRQLELRLMDVRAGGS